MPDEIISVDDIKEHLAKAALAWADFWHPPTDKEKREGRNIKTEIAWGYGGQVAIAILAAESLKTSTTAEKLMKIAVRELRSIGVGGLLGPG